MPRKKDTSERVQQNSKLKEPVNVREFAWTDKQKGFLKIAQAKETKMMFISGPAGTSKTLLAVYCGLHLLNEKKVSEVVYLRSAVESASAKIGALPGDVNDKFAFYNMPFYDKLEELTNKNVTKSLVDTGHAKTFPLNFSRGMSWNCQFVIIDECQNLTRQEINTLLTRCGKFSKFFILGDPDQSDINGRSGFGEVCKVFDSQEDADMGIRNFEFDEDDIVRSELCKHIVKKLKARNLL